MTKPVKRAGSQSQPVARPTIVPKTWMPGTKSVEKKIAVIINGDAEARHLSNVERAARVLKGKGYKVYVASPKRPSVGVDAYVSPTRSKVIDMIKRIRSNRDSHIVYYNTGHGKDGKEICLKGGCSNENVLKALDAKTYGQRTIIIDSCYGGNTASRFTDDPRTLFISAGTRGKTTCCAKFAPRFWDNDKNVKDGNGDGVISWRERFEHAYKGYHDIARLFIRTTGYQYYDAKTEKYVKPSFPSHVVNVTSLKKMKAQLKTLRPGQYAIIGFSAPWCGACHTYKPYFIKNAREAKGAHLFLWSESKNVRKHYGVTAIPRVRIIDAFGKTYLVAQRRKLKEALAGLYQDSTVRILMNHIMDGRDSRAALYSIKMYGMLSPQLNKNQRAVAARLIREWLVKNPSYGIRTHSTEIKRAFDDKSSAYELLFLFQNPSYRGVKSYYKVVKRMTRLQQEREAWALISIFKNSGAYSEKQLGLALELFKQLRDIGKFTRRDGVRAIRKIVSTEKHEGKLRSAIRTYERYARSHSSEALLGAYYLRNLSSHTSMKVRKTAIEAYVSMMYGVGFDETEDRYATAAFGVMLNQPKRHAPYYRNIVRIYCRAARVLKGKERIAAFKKVRGLPIPQSAKSFYCNGLKSTAAYASRVR